MTSLVYFKSKKTGVVYVYVNEKSDRDGKYHRKCIGHLDTFSGEIVPNRKKELSPQPRIRSYGVNAVLRKLSDEIGLTESLQVVFIDTWDSLLSMAFYCMTERKPLMDLELWMEYNETPRIVPLTKHDVVSVLNVVSSSQIESFFKVWKKTVGDENFVLTLFSSSEAVNGTLGSYFDKLFPINIEICYGKNSLFPISYVVHKSFYDVFSSTGKFDWINRNNVSYVIDGSFCSVIDVDSLMLANVKYTIPALDKDPLFREIVLENRIDNSFQDRVTKTVRRRIRGRMIFVHITYDPIEAEVRRSRFSDIISICHSELEGKRYVISHEEIYQKYFSIADGGTVDLNNSSIDEENKCLGFSVTLSNHVSIADKAVRWLLECKYAKSLFCDIQNDQDLIGMGFYSHSSRDSRVFIQFIALILGNALEKKMREKGLKCSVDDVLMSMKKLIRVDIPSRKKPMMSAMNDRQKKYCRAFNL